MTATTEVTGPVFWCCTRYGELQLSVGDEVGMVSGSVFAVPPTVHRISRITHKGKRAILDNEQVFNERGILIGSTGYRSPHLISADKARQKADPRQSRRALAHALNELRHQADRIMRDRSANEEFRPLTDDERRELLAIIDRM